MNSDSGTVFYPSYKDYNINYAQFKNKFIVNVVKRISFFNLD